MAGISEKLPPNHPAIAIAKQFQRKPTHVLAIASHVTYGYVGNKMATFVMQALGCDVSAIDTIETRLQGNHTAYGQWKGLRASAEEVEDLYDGLKKNDLVDFDMLLSGYAASKEVVNIVGKIGRDQRLRSGMKPGSFFWILDPVMGDQGRLYVADDIVPVYRSLLPLADLILPNAFEAELLAEMKITDMKSLVAAIKKLHLVYQAPHIIITSVRFTSESEKFGQNEDMLLVVGSSCRSDFTPRIFSINVPRIPIFFSGTGDMFAALILCRLREAVENFTFTPKNSTEVPNATNSLLSNRSWLPPDSIAAVSLPLARATEKTLASMHTILTKTAEERESELKAAGIVEEKSGDPRDKRQHMKRTKASEVRVVKYADELRQPSSVDGVKFEAKYVELS